MSYNPSYKPSNQIGVASVTYRDEVWIFYYESSSELYVLRGRPESEHYTHSPVLDENNHRIKANPQAHPLAVTLRRDGLRLYYLEIDSNHWKELIIIHGQENSAGAFNKLNLKAATPAVLSTTVIGETLEVYLSVEGTVPKFTVASNVWGGRGWSVKTVESPRD
ncbi:hypothetical protein MMC07_002489 [Pseudocyphellaria aurata]|nr:hypothetical protein [Pseudocyphellaria aurata]